jgi:hypothetical protein
MMTKTSLLAATSTHAGNSCPAARRKWHSHSCLCAVAKARPPLVEDLTSLPSEFFKPCHEFLIANLELRFKLSPIRISDLKFSNRKFSAISLDAFQPSATHLPTSAVSFSSIQRRASCLQNLIETPRLEFFATPTKQSSLPISNRYKNAFFAPRNPAIVGIPRFTLVVSPLLTQETQ